MVQSSTRREKLQKNFTRMFWIQALLNVRMLNVVSTLFFIHRGLTIEQVFYLAIAFSVVNIALEVPSSYLADRWGRKKTIVLAITLLALEKVIYFTADSYTAMLFALGSYAAAFALFTGTDDALVYDTTRELGEENQSVKELGRYYSAQRFAKIVTPLVGALIAQHLLDWQFNIIIAIDLFAVAIALYSAFKLVEPYHHMDAFKQKQGILVDAFNLVRTDPVLIRTIISRTLIFIASFLVWRVHQLYFVDRGVLIVFVGIGMCLIQSIAFWLTRRLTERKSVAVVKEINRLNLWFTVFLIVFVVVSVIAPNPWFLLLLFVMFNSVEPVRWPLYSELYNKRSFSFNRATTLSLSNLIKCFFDIPLLFFGAWLVSQESVYLFAFAALLAIISVVLFRVPRHAIPATT
ncbi:MAG: hypothetical protein A2848_02045 [Candidatus Magasanikbacteria bacterium RIFCSPHIGHO2_01_FULL_50_8]|uniref:Major facilitator superfamily (MFS) profile domain-containing protein n=2 Tax=Candidatus Magasanikiibacteriota TaxID=1752731 RepID=A0A1F6LPE1_9BACT|nr:MAG: hypothetical protein A2848_02045 [Candidatus Magasanikbacteria bacterium RIFCSPHIGHO2_01_FULL_50_8]